MPALGELRAHRQDQRFRVIGVMEPKGRRFSAWTSTTSVYVPVARGMKLFNQDELFEIDVIFSHERPRVDTVETDIKFASCLTERHGRQRGLHRSRRSRQMLEVFGNVMNVITLSVGGIAGISLVVGAIGILTMMWIAVNERTFEIGLMRALGGTPGQVRNLFLTEAIAIAMVGGAVGVAAGIGVASILRTAVPGIPVFTPVEYIAAALAVSFATGLVAGVVPAQRAAALDPIEALRAE